MEETSNQYNSAVNLLQDTAAVHPYTSTDF